MYAFLEQANERVPSAEEIAKELDMTVSDVKESMKNSGRHVSMDAPLVEGEDSNLYDVLKSGESPNPDKKLLHESLKTEIERSLETLTPREAAGKIAPCGKIYKSSLPTLYYMAIKAMEPITKELLDDGVNPKTPVAVIYNAGARDQEIIRTSLENLPEHGRESCINKPGLILIGENSTYKYNKTFACK